MQIIFFILCALFISDCHLFSSEKEYSPNAAYENKNSTFLTPNELHFKIPSGIGTKKNFLRYLPSFSKNAKPNKVVLYIHGATFPSALSIAYPFNGHSWRDHLVENGYHVWSIDFLGYGESDRYDEMNVPAERNKPLGRAFEIGQSQILEAARFITRYHDIPKISLIAHSWGTMATGIFATRHPELVDKLVFFAPIVHREKSGLHYLIPFRDSLANYLIGFIPSWKIITLEDQWKRFREDIPKEESPVILRQDFDKWGKAFLESDPYSRSKNQQGVKIPSGPFVDILSTWYAGYVAYDPAQLKFPMLVIRGEWDSLFDDADEKKFMQNIGSRTIWSIKIENSTHLLLLEKNRLQLYQSVQEFLNQDLK